MTRLALVAAVTAALAAVGGCSKRREEPAPAPKGQGPALPVAELQRGEEACAAYVKAVCTCAETVPAAQRPCALAEALPEALKVAIEVGASQDSARGDVAHAADLLRKTIAECIQQTAALPGLGCAAPTLE